MGLGDLVAGANKPADLSGVYLGIVTAVNWSTGIASVNIAGSVIPARMSGEQPTINRPVWVQITGNAGVIIGRVTGPNLGTVLTAPNLGRVAVLGDDNVRYTLRYNADATLASGNRVLINWAGEGYVVCRVTTQADETPPPPPPVAPVGGEKSAEFRAIDSGTWRNGWQPDVYYSSTSHSGAFFYGTAIADTIPNGAPILEARIFLQVIHASGGATAEIGTHPHASRPGGAFGIDNEMNIGAMPNGFAGDVGLNGTIAGALRDGSALGVGFEGPGYRILAGTQRPGGGGNGRIFIRWRE